MSRKAPRYKRLNNPLPAPTNNLFQVNVIGSIESQLTISTFYYLDNSVLGTVSPTQEADLGAAWITNMAPSYQGCLSADWNANNVTVRCLTSPTRVPVLTSFAAATHGTGPAGHLPTQMGMVIIRKANWRGQSGRGRLTTPAVPTSFATLSSLSAAGATALTALAAALKANFTGASITYGNCVVSRRGLPPSVSYGAGIITQTLPTLVLGTIRRRKLGKGK